MAELDVTPMEVHDQLEAGEAIFLLDVREPDEVTEWAFPSGVNIPMGDLSQRIDELPTDRPIVVACHSGVRSAAVATALRKAGWPAQNLAGGAAAWVESGLT